MALVDLATTCTPAFSQLSCDPGTPLAVADFQNGDLLFPKIKGQWIARQGQSETTKAAEQTFLTQHGELVATLEKSSSPHDGKILSLMKRVNTLQKLQRGLDYSEWPDTFTPRSTRGSPFGHVGILERVGSSWAVIDADWDRGVQRTTFQEWRHQVRRCQPVWRARLSSASPDIISRMVELAAGYIGKPYRLLHRDAFDLSNSDSFYCSKLVWYAYFGAASEFGIAEHSRYLDGHLGSARDRFITPLQLLNSPLVSVRDSSGDYKTR